MKKIVSGIRPTGSLHLGNYFGALQNFIRLQQLDDADCYFFVADYHSLTTHPHPDDIRGNVKKIIVDYLAAGLDPERVTLYVQSDVPEVIELYLFLNMNAYVGELERCASFKDKVRQNPNNVNAGLLTYPTLMAADILLHHADFVPVGKDQMTHLEMTRSFGNRFNRIYGVDYFKEPQAFNFNNEPIKIPGLNGSTKMGKSEGEGNAIFLDDEPAVLKKKVMRAVTDGGPTQPNQPKPQAIENLFQLMRVVSAPETLAFFEEKWNDMSIRYGDMKKQLAEDMETFVAPIRERIHRFESDDAYIDRIIRQGAEKSRVGARQTVQDVREIVGFRRMD
ncbi:MAG: tryptophan--tRNA ligase [Paludibacteraceae bacterium]|nr:tryptophan--tRNA ligase [Paludibacteraceae bacterium]